MVLAKRRRRLLQREKTKAIQQFRLSSSFCSNRNFIDAEMTCIKKVMTCELRLAELTDYLENEPEKFKASWKEWENEMKNFYMNEAELDPQLWKAVQVKDESTNHEPQVRFLNLQTGKLQVEHPHKAKIFQIKQRQWLGATRTREATVAKATKEVKDIEQMEIGPNGSLSYEMNRLRRSV